MKITSTKKSVRDLVEQIISDQCAVYCTDDGQGCGGPGALTPDELQAMCDDDSIDDYTTCDPAEVDRQAIRNALSANGHDGKGDDWIIAVGDGGVDSEGQSNPYLFYLILWDTDA